MAARVEHVITSGTFSLDGGTWDVDNNVWLIGDDDEVIVVDAAHDARPIIATVGHRQVRAIVCTHAHNDHVSAAPFLSTMTGAPILLHPGDHPLWELSLPGVALPRALGDDQRLSVAGTALTVLHTPGHSPGSVCLYAAELEAVFTGDTLFKDGPGATGRSFSDFDTIIESIRTRLLTLPGRTRVHTGHGPDTSIGAEALGLQDWIARGH
jgi:glyoxylase-like metal-dependent hydrolase (beta-lactamase superfamily II)